jgi:hypothetical protein
MKTYEEISEIQKPAISHNILNERPGVPSKHRTGLRERGA